jgi:Raffinose synthase or seed imbibition protein Sip1
VTSVGGAAWEAGPRSASQFFLEYFFSKKFRKKVKKYLRCCIRSGPDQHVKAARASVATTSAVVLSAGALLLATGADPFTLVDRAVVAAAALSGGAKPLAEKELPEIINLFGWCTWDAFYSRVSAQGALSITLLACMYHTANHLPHLSLQRSGFSHADTGANFLNKTKRSIWLYF